MSRFPVPLRFVAVAICLTFVSCLAFAVWAAVMAVNVASRQPIASVLKPPNGKPYVLPLPH